jgi:predicted O-linked N-acetylglucosamine transferase (SPINDLY family)
VLRHLLRSAWAQAGAGRANEKGLALWNKGRAAEAEAAFRSALAVRPRFAPACSNLGMVLLELGRPDEGLSWLYRAVELDALHVGARINLASGLHQLGRVEAAAEHVQEALRMAPEDPLVQSNTLRPLMDVCAWDAVAARVEHLVELARSGGDEWAARVSPFVSLLLPLDEATQLRIARYHARRVQAGVRPMRLRAARKPRGRLRVGYVSSDFHDHATAYLCAGVFEAHERERMEVFAYSLGQDDAGEYRRRIASACEHFVDVGSLASEDIAARIAHDGIDILVDMKGYTGGARPEIFALRPAPLQVGWLGYPGTTGADFLDYMIADAHTLPPGHEAAYQEKIVRLPGSYQPNDRRLSPGASITREAGGLPPHGFVFCCFNQHFKIEPCIFDSWMRVLAAVPGSVLWLIAGNRLSEERLRDAARHAGVDPGRLLFAPLLPRRAHLARLRLADVFLDTHYVNAHTTGSDALHAGVPVLTWAGATFASRVGASLAHAAALPELAVGAREAYESLAVELARSPQRLREFRARLESAGGSCPLFDTAAYARHLEHAFEGMWRRHTSGRSAEAFSVSAGGALP